MYCKQGWYLILAISAGIGQMMCGDDKRRQIIQAVEKLTCERKVCEITLDEVAAAAGIGKGTIYHYFKDKEDLFFK